MPYGECKKKRYCYYKKKNSCHSIDANEISKLKTCSNADT